jgi:hypothetical protein
MLQRLAVLLAERAVLLYRLAGVLERNPVRGKRSIVS